MQWLIDIAIKAMKDWYALYGGFHDRGDPAAVDFVLANFEVDGNWHELDLSAIIPDGAKAVLFRADFEATTIEKAVWFRKPGNTNTINMSIPWTQVATAEKKEDYTCPISTDRKLEYNFRPAAWLKFDFVVKGWWF